MTSLAVLLDESAAQYPDRPAVRHDDRILTYAALDEAAGRVAALLAARGVSPGSPVGLMLPNVPEFAVLYYGILRAGGVVVPMNPLLKEREVEYYLSDSGAALLFATAASEPHATAGAGAAGAETVLVDGDFSALLGQQQPAPRSVARADDDLAVLLYTSGTTGQPKGAQLTHANLRHNAWITATTLLSLSPDDVVMGCLPLFHAFGQSCGLNAAVSSGACLTLVPRFDPRTALAVMERDRVTVFEGVPTMFSALLQHGGPADTSSLRLGVSGGAALPVQVLEEFESGFGALILEGYGLSETSPVASFNHPGRERKAGSIGTPVQGVEMRLVDDTGNDVATGEVGEIAVRGLNVMRGYHNRPEATREAIPDGWFRTGDLARQDDDGYFFIVDRKKSLIIRGGYNVYPREIEEVLYQHPAVAEAAVVGVPHAELGEEVGAAVALRAESTPEQIREFVRERVAAYKYPRKVWVVDSLPKGPTGKILRREVTIPAEVRA
ncbi:long-chain fatty acid--CoA ligase [Pseudonocardia sp. C8]|uniref:long-chain-fatty-acid--CoA ligase n=1 Tax=Pseudonocardia sp. C8 TaxID=2762759 RepID=UPI0016432BC3|nr:long-chain fatty acid--CoA ligase [Pseudonocardia sp. C8]MBC3190338.1 long-chain fatty acid--CoA ligase [Pseudonocardia sp. C8]